MSQINLKSISGITSITTPAGADDVFTVHSNDTTQIFRVDHSGNQNITGIITATNFVGNLTGNVTGNITGGASSITGSPDVSLGNVNAGIVTATQYYGDGSTLSNVTSTTINNNADNRIITGSDTANTLEGESLLTFDGNVLLVASNSYNILEMRADENNDGGNDDNILKFTHDGTFRGEIRYDESSSTLELSTSDNRGDIVIDTSGNVSVGNTISANQIILNSVTTAVRNTGVSTAVGTMIYNSTTNKLQVYTGGTAPSWVNFSGSTITVSGGTVSNNSDRANFITHTFNSPGIFTFNKDLQNVEVMVIGGGGGGGGRRYGSGGGAGGVVFSSGMTLTAGSIPVVIGSGGSSNSQNRGNAGSNSTFGAGTPVALTAKGGGGGGSYDGSGGGGDGGSGGGATSRPGYNGGSATQPSTNPSGTDYGNRGGNYGPGFGGGWATPGGGGAGNNGTDTPGQIQGGGNGGIGVQLSISGSATYYAGGGAGSIYASTAGPAAYQGVGGNGGGGSSNSSVPGSYLGHSAPGHGAANSGGGGTGSHAQTPGNNFMGDAGASGGSGKVVVAYPTNQPLGEIEVE